jgi:formylglycine-generating enzyme required for sulfatase activity
VSFYLEKARGRRPKRGAAAAPMGRGEAAEEGGELNGPSQAEAGSVRRRGYGNKGMLRGSRRVLAVFVLIGTAGSTAQVAFSQGASTGETEQMVGIPGGTYPIGSDQGREDEPPAHQIMLEPFWIDRYEVTNAQFVTFLQAVLVGRDVRLTGDAAAGTADARVIQGADAVLLMEHTSAPDRRTLVALNDEESRIGIKNGRLIVQPGFERHPVNEVTWNGARAYCAGRGARLPTEAEWEAAARGREGRLYPWGNQPPTAERAVFACRSNETEPVGSRPAGATPEGIHDLAGNVAEWASTLYRPYPYRRDDGREDLEARGERVTRGGDHVFDSTPEKLRAAYRAGFSRATDVGHRHIGFRCAK